MHRVRVHVTLLHRLGANKRVGSAGAVQTQANLKVKHIAGGCRARRESVPHSHTGNISREKHYKHKTSAKGHAWSSCKQGRVLSTLRIPRSAFHPIPSVEREPPFVRRLANVG